MLVSLHVIVSAIVSIILYPFLGWYTLVFFLSAFLIDVDHYIEYAVEKKDLSLVRAYKSYMHYYHKNKANIKKGNELEHYKLHFHIFHFIEVLIIISLLSFIHKFFLYVTLGMVFHIIQDLIGLFFVRFVMKANLGRAGRYYSLIYYLIKMKD